MTLQFSVLLANTVAQSASARVLLLLRLNRHCTYFQSPQYLYVTLQGPDALHCAASPLPRLSRFQKNNRVRTITSLAAPSLKGGAICLSASWVAVPEATQPQTTLSFFFQIFF